MDEHRTLPEHSGREHSSEVRVPAAVVRRRREVHDPPPQQRRDVAGSVHGNHYQVSRRRVGEVSAGSGSPSMDPSRHYLWPADRRAGLTLLPPTFALNCSLKSGNRSCLHSKSLTASAMPKTLRPRWSGEMSASSARCSVASVRQVPGELSISAIRGMEAASVGIRATRPPIPEVRLPWSVLGSRGQARRPRQAVPSPLRFRLWWNRARSGP